MTFDAYPIAVIYVCCIQIVQIVLARFPKMQNNFLNSYSLSRHGVSLVSLSLPDLQSPQNHQQAIHCLNLLVTNALHHVPDVLTYMDQIQNQSVFNFCDNNYDSIGEGCW